MGLGTDKPHLQMRKTKVQQAGHSFRVPQLGGNRARAHSQVLKENSTHGSIIHFPLPSFWQETPIQVWLDEERADTFQGQWITQFSGPQYCVVGVGIDPGKARGMRVFRGCESMTESFGLFLLSAGGHGFQSGGWMESQRHVLWNTLPNTASSPPSLSLSDESCSPSAGLTEGIQVRCRWTLWLGLTRPCWSLEMPSCPGAQATHSCPPVPLQPRSPPSPGGTEALAQASLRIKGLVCCPRPPSAREKTLSRPFPVV